MRVIAGHFRSRALVAPAGLATRPTTDRLRETLFNVLAARAKPSLDGAIFADLYAGSGAVGIEALSRGAAYCFFVETAPTALAAIRKNLASLGIGPSQATVVAQSVATVVKQWPLWQNRAADIIFLDPPYDDADAYTRVLHVLGGKAASALAQNAIVVAEHAASNTRKNSTALGDSYGSLHRTRLLEQSDAALSFYELRRPAS
jgi:16S rRNA (guanine(966)-N(2))-methyltransferase RsmD